MKKLLTIIISCVLLFSIGGVYATWEYASHPAYSVSSSLEIKISEFNWSGSGILPDDDVIGENHLALIEQIISHPEHGLNKSKSYLNEQIEKRQDGGIGWSSGRDTLGSMAVDQSEELEEIFGLSAQNLNFLIQFKSSTEYYIFTTNVYLGERGEINWLGNNSKPGNPATPIGQSIYPIYRTKVVKTNGVWAPVETKEGYAASAWYEESRRNANATQIPSFDPDTFVEGKLQ